MINLAFGSISLLFEMRIEDFVLGNPVGENGTEDNSAVNQLVLHISGQLQYELIKD